jgi:hypothetical protein
VRRLETTVEIPNGQSVVLAGLLAESPAAPGCSPNRPVLAAIQNVGHRLRRSCPEPVDVLMVVTPQILPCGGAMCAVGEAAEPLPPIDPQHPAVPDPYRLPAPASTSRPEYGEMLPMNEPFPAEERTPGLLASRTARRATTATAGELHPSQSVGRPPLGAPGPLRTNAQASAPPRASTSWFGFRWLRPSASSR